MLGPGLNFGLAVNKLQAHKSPGTELKKLDRAFFWARKPKIGIFHIIKAFKIWAKAFQVILYTE